MPLPRLAYLLAALACLLTASAQDRAAMAEEADHVTISHDDARTFRIARPNGPAVRITFLSATAFRVHVLTDDDVAPPLDYMRVKSDASYSVVPVLVETARDRVRFTTSAIELRLSGQYRVISLDARAGAVKLIENWKIEVPARSALLDLRPGEHIYGFGDKRAALDQRGQRIEMINKDAYASEGNDSYKSIPFYMSSAGY